jgi:hypothetical protein
MRKSILQLAWNIQISNFELILRAEEDVGWLEISMDDIHLM